MEVGDRYVQHKFPIANPISTSTKHNVKKIAGTALATHCYEGLRPRQCPDLLKEKKVICYAVTKKAEGYLNPQPHH